MPSPLINYDRLNRLDTAKKILDRLKATRFPGRKDRLSPPCSGSYNTRNCRMPDVSQSGQTQRNVVMSKEFVCTEESYNRA